MKQERSKKREARRRSKGEGSKKKKETRRWKQDEGNKEKEAKKEARIMKSEK